MIRGAKRFQILLALRLNAQRGGNSKWALANTVRDQVTSVTSSTFHPGETQTILNKLAEEGYAAFQSTEKRTESRGRPPEFEWAIGEKGKEAIGELLALSK